MSRAPQRPSRPFEFVRAGWGAAMLFTPRVVLTNVHGVEIDRPSLVIARILGARQLAQAVLSGVRPSPEVLAMGVWVDGVHALSAVGLAVADPSRKRAGLVDTGVAGLWAAVGYRDLVRAEPTPTRHQRRRDRLARMVLRFAPGGSVLLRRAQDDRRRS